MASAQIQRLHKATATQNTSKTKKTEIIRTSKATRPSSLFYSFTAQSKTHQQLPTSLSTQQQQGDTYYKRVGGAGSGGGGGESPINDRKQFAGKPSSSVVPLSTENSKLDEKQTEGLPLIHDDRRRKTSTATTTTTPTTKDHCQQAKVVEPPLWPTLPEFPTTNAKALAQQQQQQQQQHQQWNGRILYARWVAVEPIADDAQVLQKQQYADEEWCTSEETTFWDQYSKTQQQQEQQQQHKQKQTIHGTVDTDKHKYPDTGAMVQDRYTHTATKQTETNTKSKPNPNPNPNSQNQKGANIDEKSTDMETCIGIENEINVNGCGRAHDENRPCATPSIVGDWATAFQCDGGAAPETVERQPSSTIQSRLSSNNVAKATLSPPHKWNTATSNHYASFESNHWHHWTSTQTHPSATSIQRNIQYTPSHIRRNTNSCLESNVRDSKNSSSFQVGRTLSFPHLSAMRQIGRNSFNTLLDLQKLPSIVFSLIIIINMLPLFCAGMLFPTNLVASDFDSSQLRSDSNSELHPWGSSVPAKLEHLPKPTKSPKCDQTFVSRIGGPQNGTFSAPLLHNHKNHSRQCLYTFLAGPGQRVEVLFTSFNLRGSPPDGSAVGELPACVHEYMDIYSEVQSSDPAELINSPFGGRYCGTIPPRRRISMYRAVAISFFTNKNVSMPDLFEGTYRFINASEYEIGIPIAGSPCSYTITPSMSINKTGALISPTYPGAYPKDMSCTYQFLGEKNQRVRLEFRDFDLFFGGPHCPFDYVKVYDGPDNSSALVGTYCGQQRNLVLYSSESSLFVHFYTLPRTANTQNRGFKGIYEFSESFVKLDFIRENDGIHIRGSECDQKILSRKESTGFVLSPNYPYPYIPKTVCRYFIYGMQDAQHLERVRLEFSAFNIPKVEHKDKSESNCTDGYLKIYLKGQETADAYDKFDYELCGNETQRVISDGPRLAMVFSSGELQGRGFKGKYTFETEYKIPGTAAPDGTCSFTYVSSSKKRGELNSPRYPSNYPSETNCSYLFLGEPNEQVTIVFDHFKVKADGNANATAGAYGSNACFEDWLEMYVVYRDNNDRFLGRYCGLTAPGPVESPRGAVGLRITLHTDHENVASGFKARYFFETAKSDVGDCGGNFSNEDSGIITSPNYPAVYKAPGRGMASMACNWIMTARPGYKLSINFEHFSIEGDPANRGCPAAVLRLWVNVDSDQPPLELCGEKPPIEQWHYISTGQTARISFTTSDKTVGAQGFRIVWTEIQDSGPGPPSIGLLCESTYHFQCDVGYCISDKLRCDGVKNCGPGDNSDEMHCITEAPEEDHGVLIIIVLVVLFLICLLCTLCHSRRKRRNQLGLHRNAHYDSQTSATVGLSSSRRHLQAVGGSLHGINSGNLILPPAPLPPTSVPSYYVSGDDDDDLDDDDDDDMHREIYINDVRFEETPDNHVIHLDV